MLPKWFTPILVASIAGLSIWLLSSQAPKKPRLITLDNTVPDTYMENFTTQILDKQGNLRHEIVAVHMAHFAFDDHSEFTSPQFTFYRPENPQWIISAEKGTAKNGSEQIILHGDVIMLRTQTTDDKSDMKITTRELLIRPDDSYVETDQLITITSGAHSLQSNGIRAYFDEGRVELLSRVRGVYAL